MNVAEAIHELAHGFTHASIGENFFNLLSESLSRTLKVEYVFIGELSDKGNTIRSVAFYGKRTYLDPVEYPVVGSLCEYVIQPKFCAFPSGVQEQFPYNKALKHFDVDSYAGLPLLNSQGKVIGLIYVMHSTAITDVAHIEAILSIVAKRAAMELERIHQEKQMQAHNQALIAANEELAKARQALMEANQKLEHRVEERTRELYSREEELKKSLAKLEEMNRTLSEREAFLGSIIDQTSVGIALVNLDGRFVFTNEGYCKITGWTEEQLHNKTLMDITYPEDLIHNRVLLGKLIEAGERFEIEKRYMRPDGSLVWCLINVSKVEPAGGLPPRIMAVCQDITRRKHSEQELIRTEERFNLLTKATNDAIWDWDLHTDVLWWNEGFHTMFGYCTEQLEPSIDFWYNRIHPEDKKRVVDDIHQVIEYGGKQWSAEYRFRRADGAYAYILDRGYALQDEQGKAYRMIGSMLDLTERREASEKLRNLTTEYQFLANFIPTIVWRAFPDGYVDYFNERWYNYTGFTPEHSIDDGWKMVLHPDDYERTLLVWQQSLATGENYKIEYRLKKADGTYRWFLGQALALKDKDGKITKWFGICTDIHEQKQTEVALQQSQQQEQQAREHIEQQQQFLHSLFSQLPAILGVISGPNYVFELANESFRKLLGKRSIIGKPLQEITSQTNYFLLGILQNVYYKGERFVGEAFPIKSDWENTGNVSTKYFDFVFEPFRNETGGVEGVITFGYEVTTQVMARQILEKNEAKVRLILESIPHLAWTSLPRKEINYFNKRWYEYTGLTEEESIDKAWQKIIHAEDLPLVIERRTAGRSKGEPYEIENRYRRASDGTYRWHLARVVPIHDEQGKIIMWVGTATDIHDQKLSQQALENTLNELHEKNFELDQFVYKTSHDLRAPLTTIMGLVSIFKNEKNEATKAHYIDLIENRVNKLDTFIKSMLDYSRNTRTATRIEKINIETLLEECIGELEYMRHFARLHIDLQIHVKEIYADVFRLRIIFSNLISNAIKYQDFNKQDSRLFIKTESEGNRIIITFADNGVGIDQAYQDRIFSMFFRAAEQSEGSGLGLYIVKQAAAVLHGNIHLQSEAGIGTQFTVTLPRNSNPGI